MSFFAAIGDFDSECDVDLESGRVAVQAGKEPGEVHPEQSYHNDHHTHNGPCAVNTGVSFAKHIAEMEISYINQPRCQRPEFFGVPAPVIAPAQLAPAAAEDKAEC